MKRLKEAEALKLFEGKLCRIVWKDGSETHAAIGQIQCLNESYLVEKDLDRGQVYFLRFQDLIKIEEVSSVKRLPEQEEVKE